MRTVVALLLLANLVYAIWHFQFESESEEVKFIRSPARSAPETLVLVGESDLPLLVSGQIGIDNGCLELGLFNNLSSAADATELLQEIGFPSYVSEKDVQADTRFWVLMPPFSSDITLQNRLEELAESGISNSQILGGELDKGISLGIFPDFEAAQSLQSSLTGEGYATEVREIDQTETQIKVVVEGLPNRILSSSQWLDFLDLQQDLEVSEKLCETIAQ